MVAMAAKPGEGFSVLITDDDDASRESISDIFTPLGFETHLAACGREAIDIAREVVLHCLIMDMYLPDLTGVEAFKIIARDRRAVLPCVIISADESSRGIVRALPDEALAFVPKPLNLPRIRSIVRDFIDRYFI